MKPGSLKIYMYNTVAHTLCTHNVATSFVNTVPHYWNALPCEIRNAGSKKKKRLTNRLKDTYSVMPWPKVLCYSSTLQRLYCNIDPGLIRIYVECLRPHLILCMQYIVE